MSLLEFFFGRKRRAAARTAPLSPPPERAAAPGTVIRHDPQLVEELHGDHRRLLETFGAIRDACQRSKLAAAQQQLERFRIQLKDHLLKENIRLYVYLEHLHAADPARHALVRGFRREMDSIGRVVVDFFTQYREVGLRPELAGAFAADLGRIGEALAARIKREEETLYPLYLTPLTA